MRPQKELALLAAAVVAFSEIAASRETDRAVQPQRPHDHKELLVKTTAIGVSASSSSSPDKQHRYAVVKVQDDPEIFWLLARYHPEFRNGQFMKDFGNFSRHEMRDALGELGCSENESIFLIEKARRSWH